MNTQTTFPKNYSRCDLKDNLLEHLDLIIDIPDYPVEGVTFKDVTPLIADAKAFQAAIDTIARQFFDKGITKVLGAEARGVIIGAPVAYVLGAGFVPARKPGKLPRATYDQSYNLEYGQATIQIHQDAFCSHDRVLIVDDLLATGGTALAQAELVARSGATLVGMGFLMELAFLNPRGIIASHLDTDIYSAIIVED